ncbi:MAG: sigma-70 family RNA polymerase sigma factor [Actinomycetota bacterium]|uniref:RNA polymerase sigma factor n=1 Tax=Mycobacterium lentiflavum TaxID=141349 RepID=A0ABY3UTS4_MYCLN|nr:sigma-70 family RNA polymerase sigma factor [Mycobacterium lentiflavum]MEE3065273.1 sigma-70 family RNA polymerase sigma factor [Actinomycetota bacterium]ULP42172.1 sigma-70 family RNA polymerase sigma factor [Mycobacterium lentiflavum]
MTLPAELTADARPTAEFERQVAPVLGDLHRHAMRMTRHRADAEDLVQDTMASAFAAFSSLRADSTISAWLYRILVNTHISNCRKMRRRPALVSADRITERDLVASSAHSALPSAEDQALQRLGDQDVIAALRALPDVLRVTVYYADVEGLGCKEISVLMDAPVGTVRSRLHRGHRQLRGLLADKRGRGSYYAPRGLAQTA